MLKRLYQLQPDGLVSVLERGVQMELEAGLEELHLLGNPFAVSRETVQDEQLRDEVEEHQRTRPCTEGYMLASGLHLETSAHRALNIERLLLIYLKMSLFFILECGNCTHIFQTVDRLVDIGGEALGHPVRLDG